MQITVNDQDLCPDCRARITAAREARQKLIKDKLLARPHQVVPREVYITTDQPVKDRDGKLHDAGPHDVAIDYVL